MRFLKTLLVLILGIGFLYCGWTFAILNTELVTIDLFFIKLPEASLSVWLMAVFVLGGLSGVIISSLALMTLRLRLQNARRKISAANKELDQLRTVSLKNSA